MYFRFDGPVPEKEGKAVSGSEYGSGGGTTAVLEGDQETAVEGTLRIDGIKALLQQIEGVQGIAMTYRHGVRDP